MIFRNGGSGRAAAIFLIAALLGGAAGTGRVAADEPFDPDAQYRDVLTAMKSPPVSGVLITEIGPESAAGKAGAAGGDVITSYAGRNITDLHSLREAVAEVLAAREVEGNTNKLLLGVRRGSKDLVLQIDPAPLGIRAIEVEAGVPAELNPPPSLRGTITLHWDQLVNHPDTDPIYLRTSDGASKAWIGWQERTQTYLPGSLTGEIRITHLDPGETPNTATLSSTEKISFHVATGDYKTSAAFVLDELHVTSEGDYETVTTNGTRVGAVLKLDTTIATSDRTYPPVASEHALPLNAIPSPAAPMVAAAIAGEKDAVLPLTLMSVRDYISRPGYVLAARGEEKLPEGGGMAWRVDLLQCGVVVEKYWFDEKRELMRIDIGGGSSVTSVRASSAEAAELPVRKKEIVPPLTTRK